MALYKLEANNYVRKVDQGLLFPPDKDNADYSRYLAWLDEGNTPDPPDPLPLKYNENTQERSRVRTTNAATTEIYRAKLLPMTGYVAELRVLAVDLGNGAMKEITAHIMAKRLGAGAIIVGTPTVISNIQDTGATTWTVQGTTSGEDFVVTVTGAAGRTIEWSLVGTVLSFTPNGR